MREETKNQESNLGLEERTLVENIIATQNKSSILKQELKDKITERIISPTAKAFFRQSCYLTKIQSDLIELEVASNFLYDIARRQCPDIIRGAEEVFGHSVHIELFVNPELKDQKPS